MDAQPKIIIVELSTTAAETLAKALLNQQRGAHAQLEHEVTPERARQIRVWRCDDGFTWGSVGKRWKESYGVSQVGSQILGQALCYWAAVLLGESPYEPPWN